MSRQRRGLRVERNVKRFPITQNTPRPWLVWVLDPLPFQDPSGWGWFGGEIPRNWKPTPSRAELNLVNLLQTNSRLRPRALHNYRIRKVCELSDVNQIWVSWQRFCTSFELLINILFKTFKTNALSVVWHCIEVRTESRSSDRLKSANRQRKICTYIYYTIFKLFPDNPHIKIIIIKNILKIHLGFKNLESKRQKAL